MAGNITPQQLQDMINAAVTATVTNAVNNALGNLQLPQGPPGARGPPGPSGQAADPGISTGSDNGKWNATEIGYFDPHLDKSYGDGEIVTVGKDVYYRSVLLFVERIKDVASVKGEAIVRTNLNTCFRGSALAWYTAELSNLERRGLRAEGNGIEDWCQTLSKRFKEPTGVALAHLTTEKYTMNDARNRREPAAYVQSIIRHAKAAEIESTQNQLTFAYQGIVAELRAFIDPPQADSTVGSFIQILELKKDTWFEMSSRQRSQMPFQANQQHRQLPNHPRDTAFQSQSSYRSAPSFQQANVYPRGYTQPPRQGQPTYANQSNPIQSYGQPRTQYGQQPYRPQAPPNRPFVENAYRSPQYGYQPNPRYEPRQEGYPRRPPQSGPPRNESGSMNRQPPAQPNQAGYQDRRFGNQVTGSRPPFQQNFRPKAAAYHTSAEPDRLEDSSDQHQETQELSEENTQFLDSEMHANQHEIDEFSYDETPESQEDSFDIGFVGIQVTCHNCGVHFSSKTKLHKHLRTQTCTPTCPSPPIFPIHMAESVSLTKPLMEPQKDQKDDEISSIEIVESSATDRPIGTGFSFRGWNYARFSLRFQPTSKDEEGCADTGTGVTLADKSWMLRQIPDLEIKKMSSSLRVKGLGSSMHNTDEYVLVPMYLPAKKEDGVKVLCCIRREIHLVKDLKANMLMGNDILGPERIILDMGKGNAFIGSCGSTIEISTRQREGPYTKRVVQARNSLTVAPRSDMLVPVSTPQNLPQRDFLFEPKKQKNLTTFAHIVDSQISGILVKNESDFAVKIPRKLRLGVLHEIDYENVFFAEESHLTDDDFQEPIQAQKGPRNQRQGSKLSRNWIKQAATLASIASMSVASSYSTLVDHTSLSLLGAGPSESKLSNGVMVYGDQYQKQQLSQLCDEFPELWIDQGFARVPPDEWMKLPLRSDWESRMPSSNRAKVYPLGIADREVVDKTFDALQNQGRLSFTTQSTPFSYPVFVVWKNLPNGERKGRAVVDIRGLNDLIIPDVYPVPLQTDIIANLLGCTHISVLDAVSFFYQWLVDPEYRRMLTVVSHRGQETFNVPIMGCMNSIAYVQRRIDIILRAIKDFAQAYIDDIVVGSDSFQKHLYHLRKLFQILVEYNISISPSKTFLGYPNVNLLGRHVDSLGMATAEDKLKAISKLNYPTTLGDLEHYLGLTGYLRSSVHYYAQLAEPLQKLKTMLLKDGPTKGNPRRTYSSRLRLAPPSEKEQASFDSLQEALSQPSILVHHDPNKVLWIDLDASKEFGFGAQVFHVKDYDFSTKKWPPRSAIQPIMFLSRMLSEAERNYWPTELEVAGFVWVLKKIRHLVESSKHPTIIQTDHSAILDIMKQSSITSTTSTMRMNVRLVRASQFLRQFPLEVRHKPGKEHIVPDALSRLASTNKSSLSSSHDELDALFTTTLIEMAPTFLEGLVQGYQEDDFWVRTVRMMDKKERVGLSFHRGRDLEGIPDAYADLIFHVNRFTGVQRLCVPEGMVKTILEIAHGDAHLGFERAYEKIASSWYIHGLSRHLRQFIRFCPECLLLQTRRHLPYGSLQPIESPPVPFHTLTLDFILALPETPEGFNTIMSVTDKFTKKVTFVPGKKNYSAANWALVLLARLDLVDWGIPKALISDRDRKFLSDLWSAIFKKLGVELLYSTAYHPQTDGSSERTNQTAEIALRFYLNSMEDPTQWLKVLPEMQALLNNSVSATTNKSPNEISYGFQPNRPLDLLREATRDLQQPSLARIEAADAIIFAQTNQKHHYDRKHQPMYLAEGDWAYLRLHKGYSIPSTEALGKKLSQQYVGPFEVLEKVGKLAYRLGIPDEWKIHPVFSIAQLEPAPGPDPHRRPRPTHPGSIFVEGDTKQWKSYEVQRILNKRTFRQGRGWTTQYLIRWLGYGAEHDKWYNVKYLANCKDLIEEYEEAMTRVRRI